MSFLTPMARGIQTALGNVNNFAIHIDPIDGIARMVDINYINRDGVPNLFKFEIGSNKSIVRNLNIESQIFSDQSSMVAISAQSDAGRLGLDNSTLVSYNKGVTDRMIAKKDSPLASTEINEQLNNFISSLAVLANRYLKPLFPPSGPGTYNANESDSYSNALRDVINFISSIKNSDNKDKGFIPTQISLTIDGIAGWVIGNLFKVDETFIPKYYKRDKGKSGYIVTKIGHQVENNSWTTTIKGYPFNLDTNTLASDDTKGVDFTIVVGYNPNPTSAGGGSTIISACGDVTERKYWDVKRYPAVAKKRTSIPEADIVNYIKSTKYSLSVKRSVLASVGIESGWGKSGINNNLNGVQTDGGKWPESDKYIEAVTNTRENPNPEVPGSGRCRSFATYATWQKGLDHVLLIMSNRTEGKLKQICPNDPNDSTFFGNNYVKGWGGLSSVSPAFFTLSKSVYQRAIRLIPS
jgi:hypothetical protein